MRPKATVSFSSFKKVITGASISMRGVYLAQPLICHNVWVKTENDNELIATIRNWAAELGFQDIGFTGVDLVRTRAICKNGSTLATKAPWIG